MNSPINALPAPIPPRPTPPRSEGALLAHALGNALAILFYGLDELEREHFDEERFKAAHDSMLADLRSLKVLMSRAGVMLQTHGDTVPAPKPVGPSIIEFTVPTRPMPVPDLQLPIGVLCVDDNSDITTGLRLIIDAQHDMHCEGCLNAADSLEETVRRVSSQQSPNAVLIVLLDATMSGMDPLSAMKDLAVRCPNARTIIYSGHEDPDFVNVFADAGAWGYVSKAEDPGTVLLALREVAAGRVFWRPQ